ncbi:protein spire homolog 1-like isoform X2 [Glandiceps talaboti]
MAEGPPVKVDMENRQSVSLLEILEAFSAPLNEEQTWSLCYQSSKFLQSSFKTSNDNFSAVTGPECLLLHKDGSCSVDTLKGFITVAGDEENTTEGQTVNQFGLIVYSALDYGIKGDQERELSVDLEQLLGRMIGDQEEENNNCDADATDDEGIEDTQDFDETEDNDNNSSDKNGLQINRTLDGSHTNGSVSSCTEEEVYKDDGISPFKSFTQILQVCADHLPHPSQAASHYQAVIRALVAEVQELTTFLEKISTGSKNLQRLATDKLEDEEVDGSTTDLQELGIHEWARLWMQVIKSLRQGVQLKKIGAVRHAPIEYELTPYEMVLDDIRSRRYVLKQVMVDGDIPHRVKKEAHDIILDFIRSRPPLKPVADRKVAPMTPKRQSTFERMLDEIKSVPRLKPAPRAPESKPNLCVESCTTQDPSKSPSVKKKITIADLNILDWDELDSDEDEDEEPQVTEKDNNVTERDQGHEEIHIHGTIDTDHVYQDITCVTPTKSFCKANFDSSPLEGPIVGTPRRNTISVCETKHSMGGFGDPVEYLSLTVDEVKHIRSVLCKAELENLQSNKRIYLDVLNGKVCFNCKKRFALFNRKYKCKLCKRIVCLRCCRRMKIPSEHFLHIPVHALSPSSSPTKCPRARSSFDFDFDLEEQGLRSESAPATPSCSPTMGRRSIWGRSKSSAMKDVCTECKTFMVEVLRTNRHATPRRFGQQLK